MKGPLLCSRKGDNFLRDLFIRESFRSSTRRKISDFLKIWHKTGSCLQQYETKWTGTDCKLQAVFLDVIEDIFFSVQEKCFDFMLITLENFIGIYA
jgi:hypothetical protein